MTKKTVDATDNPYLSTQVRSVTVSRDRVAVFVLLTVGGLVADLVSKWWFFSQPDLRRGAIWWVWQDYAGIQLSLNEGALFGMGQGYAWVFALFGLIAAVALPIWFFRFSGTNDWWITLAMGCIMAGILGNLYDRLALHGETWFFDPARQNEAVYAVRDWILLQWGPHYRWPNFNIADSLLVIGAGVVLLRAIIEPASNTDSSA